MTEEFVPGFLIQPLSQDKGTAGQGNLFFLGHRDNVTSRPLETILQSHFHQGSFTNYVDKIFVFFDHLTTCVDIFYGMEVDKKTTYIPRLVNVVCERPLMLLACQSHIFPQFHQQVPIYSKYVLIKLHRSVLFFLFCAQKRKQKNAQFSKSI